MDISILLIQSLNAFQYGLLLFLVASGLTLIFGIMGIINLAHGSFYMIGAYMAFALGPLGSPRLTLTRTPHLEFMLRPEQRGVSVGCAEAGQRPALLVAVQWGAHRVDVVSTAKRYSLDISRVDGATRAAALRVLGKMNFDQRFQLAST